MIAPALTALRAHNQFIIYKVTQSTLRPGKLDKLPCDASGRVVSALDSCNWLSAELAENTIRYLGEGYGVGFVLTQSTGVFCLDIDNCSQMDRTWSPLALAILGMFPGAAAEVSISGHGLHIWGTYAGDMPEHGCKNVALGIEQAVHCFGASWHCCRRRSH